MKNLLTLMSLNLLKLQIGTLPRSSYPPGLDWFVETNWDEKKSREKLFYIQAKSVVLILVKKTCFSSTYL